jgi:MYXO-CTERM domain-containing protein
VDVAFTADRFPEDVSFADASFFSVINSPAFGDMDQDGQPELLMGGASLIWTASLATSQYLEYQQAFGIWDLSTGDLLPTFPQQVEDVSFLASPSVADVTGDGKPEALFGTGGYFLNAFSADGSTPSGWPKFTGGWIMGGPSIGDVDGDGYLDVAITTRDGNLFVWCTRGHADDTPEWAGTYHDAANTGFLGTPLPAQIGPPETGGCCSKDGDKESALLALPLLLLGALRRRRSL